MEEVPLKNKALESYCMKFKTIYLMICIFGIPVLFSFCKGKEIEIAIGVVSFIKGNPIIERNKKKLAIRQNDQVYEKDVIVTDEKSLVILNFQNDLGELEIQSQTVLSIDSFLNNKKLINVKQGNVWTKITKLAKNDEFYLHSPTCVAGVRGTKFYTFQIGEYQGTCHCEGSIQLELKGQKYNEVNKEDILVLSKGGNSVVITPRDWKIKRPAHERHQHSQIENSPLGKKQEMTKVEFDAFMKTIEDKFQEMK